MLDAVKSSRNAHVVTGSDTLEHLIRLLGE